MDVGKIINVAQIGIGYWGPNLLRNLNANKNCCVRYVVDLSEERRQFVSSHYPNCTVTDNIEKVLTCPEIDAVVISTPAGTHFDLVMSALDSGKHVLVEKPMARSIEEVDKIGLLATEKKLVAMVGHTFIYNSAVRFLKDVIDSGDLGDIRYIYSQRLNLGRIRSDVDALWNFAPHDISIIQYLLDEQKPISVDKRGMDYVQNGIDDVVFMNIVYPNKILAHIHISWLDPHKVRRMTVVGSKKMVVYDDVSDNKITIYDKGIDRMAELGDHMDFDKPNLQRYSHRSGDIVIPKLNFEEPLRVEIDHFLDCIQNKTKCRTGTDHAREVVGILSNESS